MRLFELASGAPRSRVSSTVRASVGAKSLISLARQFGASTAPQLPVVDGKSLKTLAPPCASVCLPYLKIREGKPRGFSPPSERKISGHG